MNIFFIMIFSLTVNESCAIRCYVCITMRMHFMISVKHVILNPHDPRSWYDIRVVTEGKCSSVDDESQSCVVPFRHSAIFVHKRRKCSSPNLARRQVFTQEIIQIHLTPPAPALPPLLCLKRRSLKVSPEVALISLLSASSPSGRPADSSCHHLKQSLLEFLAHDWQLCHFVLIIMPRLWSHDFMCRRCQILCCSHSSLYWLLNTRCHCLHSQMVSYFSGARHVSREFSCHYDWRIVIFSCFQRSSSPQRERRWSNTTQPLRHFSKYLNIWSDFKLGPAEKYILII